MHTPQRSDLERLVTPRQAPCISLYQPTHRAHPDNQQDPIRFRNLIRQIEKLLEKNYSNRGSRNMLVKFEQLARNTSFWNHRTELLAVLASPDDFEVFDVQRPGKELVVVADSFHLKPLFRTVQSADRFQILCLDRYEISMYEGNRDAIDEVELTHVPTTITEALGTELTEPHLTAASYGMRAGTVDRSMYHGHGDKSAEDEIDQERFFRAVDRDILEHYSRPSGLPLLLAALPEHHAPFRKLSQNPFLMEQGIAIHPDSLSRSELLSQAWQKVEPIYTQRLAALLERYGTALAHNQASDDLGHVATAAIQGRIDTLLVEAGREVPGRIDPTSGNVETVNEPDTPSDDLLDDLAEQTFRTDGEVIVVPAERMPSKSGAAAIYRY